MQICELDTSFQLHLDNVVIAKTAPKNRIQNRRTPFNLGVSLN